MYAEPSIAHLRTLLRHVVFHPKEAAAKGAVARRDMVQRFSPQVRGVVFMCVWLGGWVGVCG
jgi:hypothetical protein